MTDLATDDPIRFGTDGWRGVVADTFTFANVERLVQAACDNQKARYPEWETAPILIGYDTRFLSDRFARTAARVVAANGFRVFLSRSATTTPTISWAVKSMGAQAGFIVTASHNPAEYNGFKIKAHYGGSATVEDTHAIERLLGPIERVKREGGRPVESFDPKPSYLGQLRRLVDVEAIRNRLATRRGVTAGLRWPELFTVVDNMHGASGGYFSELFGYPRPQTDFSPPQFLAEIRVDRDALFGQSNPEPTAQNLKPLVDTVARESNRYTNVLGIAFDGDGDRIGAIDKFGNFVNSHHILALILRHLVEGKGWSGGVVKTFSTSRLVEKMAVAYGLPVHEVPIGFKYVCEAMRREDILVGGEESGGIGIKNHIPERDGLLCGLFLMEIVLRGGKGLSEQIAELHDRFGPHYSDRIDIGTRDREAMAEFLADLSRSPPSSVDGATVTDVQTLDGVKIALGERAWVLFRPSGTEPLLRVYAEDSEPNRVKALLRFGRELAKRVTARTTSAISL